MKFHTLEFYNRQHRGIFLHYFFEFRREKLHLKPIPHSLGEQHKRSADQPAHPYNLIYTFDARNAINSERSSNSRSEFASSLYGRKQVTFLYSLQLKFLRMPHHRNFRHFNACVVHIFVLLKMKTVAILFLPTDMIHVDKSGMYSI